MDAGRVHGFRQRILIRERVRLGDIGTFNYIRNSVKATIDAYDGSVSLFVFDTQDPIIRAWQAIFPGIVQALIGDAGRLCGRMSGIPNCFSEAKPRFIARFTCRLPMPFYNKEDLWDVAKNVYPRVATRATRLAPTYVIATIPGETNRNFCLLAVVSRREAKTTLSE